ncbi:MAG: hypothetical protein ABI895_17350 [Deltaproteobacteria bacterium]
MRVKGWRCAVGDRLRVWRQDHVKRNATLKPVLHNQQLRAIQVWFFGAEDPAHEQFVRK